MGSLSSSWFKDEKSSILVAAKGLLATCVAMLGTLVIIYPAMGGSVVFMLNALKALNWYHYEVGLGVHALLFASFRLVAFLSGRRILCYKSLDVAMSWVCTTCTAAFMFLAGLHVLLSSSTSALLDKGCAEYVYAVDGTYSWISIIFLSGLHSDLVLGAWFYPTKVNLISGWVHHGVYTIVMLYSISTKKSWIFALYAIEEFPTILLGVGNIHLPWRSDDFFGLAFFTTRILWHFIISAMLFYQAIAYSSTTFTIPWGIASVMLVLHFHWILNWSRKRLWVAKKVE